ncbi:MAG: heme oxygenase [Claussenomyces sp. TS43310]|nr:MAG: heme oxygenase [Claussenomyces sp. TS43310]
MAQDEPLPLPMPSHGILPLSDQINAATRSMHTHLNRSITARLPLALPPYTTNPSTYISGLLFIAPIYINFETAWQNILYAPNLPTALHKTHTFDGRELEKPVLESRSLPLIPNTGPKPLEQQPQVCTRTQLLLAHLRLPGLLRSSRLKADITRLSGTSENETEVRLEHVSNSEKLAEFIAHIKAVIEDEPHVLVAYAWVLYMALFAGGRYLRASLQAADQDFWSRSPSPVRPYFFPRNNSDQVFSRTSGYEDSRIKRRSARRTSTSEGSVRQTFTGMQFFNFIGDDDGEDLKREFKNRITEAEAMLTSQEKKDIVSESETIFSFMIDMVAELDEVFGTSEEDIEIATQQQAKSFWRKRDSVFVARDRMSRRRDSSYMTEYRNRHSNASLTTLPDSGAAAKTVRFSKPVKVHLAGLGRGVEAITAPLGRRFSRTSTALFAGSMGDGSTGMQSKRRHCQGIVRISETVALAALGVTFCLMCMWYLFWLSA